MAVQIVMPRLGDFMTEGIVARWAKGQGEAVVQGELVAEIESEKLNYELEATSDGILHHAVDEGATVGVDDVIGYLLARRRRRTATTSAGCSACRRFTITGSRVATTCRTSRRWRCSAVNSGRSPSCRQPRHRHNAGHAHRSAWARGGRRCARLP